MHRDGDTRRDRQTKRDRDWGIIEIGGKQCPRQTDRGKQAGRPRLSSRTIPSNAGNARARDD